MRPLPIPLPLPEIEAFCRRNPITRLALFGSVLRADFTARSDVDVLVELDRTVPVGLFEFIGMQLELQDMIGRTVDLRTPQDLHPRFRQHVVDEAENLYVRQN